MRDYSLTHLSDAVLLRDLAELIAHDRVTMAAVLAHIAEVDARRLFVPAGYPSMHAYCVGELRLSEDAAFRRIRAARAGREFPTLFAGLAQGRINLAAICLLAPHLTRESRRADRGGDPPAQGRDRGDSRPTPAFRGIRESASGPRNGLRSRATRPRTSWNCGRRVSRQSR
jgi:hypothetical protein